MRFENLYFRYQQFRSILRTEGASSAAARACGFLLKRAVPKRIRKFRFNLKRELKDILFVNGCSLDHCRRYRVLHQMEQLESLDVSCDERWYEDLTLEDLKYYRAVIFYRTPFTPLIGDFITQGKSLNKRFFFDIDDLVFDLDYTKTIAYVQTLPPDQKRLYDDGVERISQTLKLCDAVITTTEELANEIKKFNANVFVNRNVASDEMVALANDARAERPAERKEVVLGYFSGSITHSPDLELIAPALLQALKKFPELRLLIAGLVELPKEFDAFKNQIEYQKLVNWKDLPKVIARIDVNLAPLEETVFNQAKSENRWMEASWLAVPTIASRVGTLGRALRDGKDALVVENTTDAWLGAIEQLAQSSDKRKQLGLSALARVRSEYLTYGTGIEFKKFLLKNLPAHIGFLLPQLEPRGGILVVLKHAEILREAGFNVTILSQARLSSFRGPNTTSFSLKDTALSCTFTDLVATLWSTVYPVLEYPHAEKRSYLVQNYEVNFLEPTHEFRKTARRTYQQPQLRYATISKWCQSWLESEYGMKSQYAPNGLNLSLFGHKPRNFEEKRWRILIEGNSLDPNKNVDESFRIVEKLPKEQFEIWYLSYDGEAKPWYRVDRFFHRVPNDQVAKIYQDAHVLLKSSILESFSYPPLEMMATGGLVVARHNGGNSEYLIHGENSLVYRDDWSVAGGLIQQLQSNSELRSRLISHGRKTAQLRDWKQIRTQIVDLYS